MGAFNHTGSDTLATLGISESDRQAIARFQRDVLDPSMTALVVLQFTAEWCGPCKQLSPLLDKVAADYAAKGVKLARIDVDQEKMIAAQFRIQSVPTVYAFYQGQPVADLSNYRTEGQITRALDQLLGQLHVEGEGAEQEAEIEPLIAMGEQILADGDAARAASVFGQIRDMAPENAAAAGGLVRALVASGETGRSIAGDLLATLHRGATCRELLLLAWLGSERAQLGHGMGEPFAVTLRHVLFGPRDGKRVSGFAPSAMCNCDRPGIKPAENVEQSAMTTRIEQTAVVMLAVNLDEMRCEFAQKPGRRRLIVDERAAAAVRFDDATDEQRLAGLELEAVLRHQIGDRAVLGRGFETGGDHRLRGTLPHQPALAAAAQCEPQGIEQDRFARARLAGQHAQSGAELKVERLDQHHVANGKRGQHARSLLQERRENGSACAHQLAAGACALANLS